MITFAKDDPHEEHGMTAEQMEACDDGIENIYYQLGGTINVGDYENIKFEWGISANKPHNVTFDQHKKYIFQKVNQLARFSTTRATKKII